MKHEKLIRGIGAVDDRILERYHDIDTRLARKHAKKAMALRMTAIAACMAVLLCAALPLSMMTNPIGRAVLRGDSEALTEQLHKIDGFVLWQDETAQKLEQSLPAGMWTVLQKTPVLNVLTQSEFAAMKPQEAFTEGMPYRLYFVSNGDGTCTLEYITTDPAFTGKFVIDIPETSPDGDTVTAIDICQPGHGGREMTANLPTVLTAGTMESLLLRARKNKISDFDYTKLCAFYLKLSVTGLDENFRRELLNAYPIVAYGDVYVLDRDASKIDQNRIYAYLTEYCEWDAEQYEQSVREIVNLAKQSESRELAELCLTAFRCPDLSGAVGVNIPKTVTSINSAMWASLPALESVTVDAEHPSLKMIDGCLVDTETGTLKLYLREDGSFPEGLDLRILDSHAFSACTLQVDAEGEASLYVPEGVREIRQHCFAGKSLVGWEYHVNIYLPVSLETFGGEASNAFYALAFYHYPGTLEQWMSNVRFGEREEKEFIYLLTSDVQRPAKFYFSKN